MLIEFDTSKREITLKERGLDFARADEVFAGRNLTREDQRHVYGERRYQTVGWLDSRLAMIVWTPRGAYRRFILETAVDRLTTSEKPHAH